MCEIKLVLLSNSYDENGFDDYHTMVNADSFSTRLS